MAIAANRIAEISAGIIVVYFEAPDLEELTPFLTAIADHHRGRSHGPSRCRQARADHPDFQRFVGLMAEQRQHLGPRSVAPSG